MNLVARGSAIDISIVAIDNRHIYLNEVLANLNSLIEKEDAAVSCVLGHIDQGTFFPVEKDGLSVGSNEHFSLKFVAEYEAATWLVFNKHPNTVGHLVERLTGAHVFDIDSFDIWTDERPNSLIAVVP